MRSKNLSSINTSESIDAPIDPEFLEKIVTDAIIGHNARLWLEEHFGGDQSDDYYRGLIAGYTHCRNLAGGSGKVQRANAGWGNLLTPWVNLPTVMRAKHHSLMPRGVTGRTFALALPLQFIGVLTSASISLADATPR